MVQASQTENSKPKPLEITNGRPTFLYIKKFDLKLILVFFQEYKLTRKIMHSLQKKFENPDIETDQPDTT